MRRSSILLFLLISCGGVEQVNDLSVEVPDVKLLNDQSKIPRSLDWSNIDLNKDGEFENYTSSVKLQPCNDCFIYAAIALVEIQFKIDNHNIGLSIDLSEQSMHNCLHVSCEDSGDPTPILNHIKKYGIIEETYVRTGEWANSCNICSNKIRGAYIDNIPFIKIGKYNQILTPNIEYSKKKDILVNALQTGPVMVTVQNWPGYKRYADNKAICMYEKMPGSHIVNLVGYKNNGDVFIAKNSHGGNDFIEIMFDGSDKCGFAFEAFQLEPNSTYFEYGSTFCNSSDDLDDDKIPDAYDNCLWKKNYDQKNSDGDLRGDVCDRCPDEKGLNGYDCPIKLSMIVLKEFHSFISKANMFCRK